MKEKGRRKSAFLYFGCAVAVVGGVFSLILILAAGYVIERNTRGAVFDEPGKLPHRHVALVLGCAPRLGNGKPNPYFVNRIEAGAAVFNAGKADYLLVSGDNHTRRYDEPTAMKEALVHLGVPEQRVVLDYAGFSTSDSILRAKLVFGQTDLCVVSQRDHAMRAVYIGRHYAIAAVGFAAKDIPARYGWRVSLRESLARVRTVFDVKVWGRKPHFTGPRIPIPPPTEP
jgi:SanA protein